MPVEQLLDGEAAPVEVGALDPALGQIHGFGRDSEGEPYLLTSNGDLLRITTD